ncbi:MAG: IS110 family transposase [Agriterribacter sp.]
MKVGNPAANNHLEDFSQDPDAGVLYKHLIQRYPGATFKACYEAGFSGLSLQRWLQQQGIDCVVVNAADVVTTNKERRQKSDKVDARKLCDHLQSRKMKAVYVPVPLWEHGRSLVRAREKIVRNQTRCKNRIWQLLYFSGLQLPKGYQTQQYWSKAFVKALQSIDCGSDPLQTTLALYIKDYEQTRGLLLQATRMVRKLCTQSEYQYLIALLRSIPGIGLINAAVILFELQDISRFKYFDHLCSYAGLVPDTKDSGETKYSRGITTRTNQYLRAALVESSWSVIRKDPALLLKYKHYCSRMDRNKAIIRIAKHLLARINYVLKNKTPYQTGIVG